MCVFQRELAHKLGCKGLHVAVPRLKDEEVRAREEISTRYGPFQAENALQCPLCMCVLSQGAAFLPACGHTYCRKCLAVIPCIALENSIITRKHYCCRNTLLKPSPLGFARAPCADVLSRWSCLALRKTSLWRHCGMGSLSRRPKAG